MKPFELFKILLVDRPPLYNATIPAGPMRDHWWRKELMPAGVWQKAGKAILTFFIVLMIAGVWQSRKPERRFDIFSLS